MSKSKKRAKSMKSKVAVRQWRVELPKVSPEPGNLKRFDQLLDDAVFGVKKK